MNPNIKYYTKDELLGIHNALRAWKDERKLSVESQRAGLIPNLLEETLEYMRASTDEERIDALCDICVFAINSMEIDFDRFDLIADVDSRVSTWKNHYDPKYMTEKHTHEWYCEFSMMEITRKISCLYHYLLDEITTTYKGNLDFERELAEIVEACFMVMFNMGYDPLECMQETIREISSRTGGYDESIGKWVKDTSDEAKAKWYKADYTKCKRS